ncbi:hypothetical protein [Brevundimonas sp. C43]|uniref:hypothetical protein n=1 Tax=Brevundimonas sp. C43 TaxID=3068314 RepID=UPI0018CF7CC5|nr:hypothetical protein [Brevundimonas sp. C43]
MRKMNCAATLIPDVDVIVGFVRLMQSPVSHFLMPTDLADEASAWLLAQGIEHEWNDLYVMGREPTGGTVISIADDLGAVAFRMWGSEDVRGPLVFAALTSSACKPLLQKLRGFPIR